MKSFKIFSILVSSIFILILTLYLAIVFVVPKVVDINQFVPDIKKELKKSTGLELSIEDARLKSTFTPDLCLALHHLKLLTPKGEDVLKLYDAEIKINLLPLIFKKIKIGEVKLYRPIISLTFFKDCTTSLDKYLTQNHSQEPQALPFRLKFDTRVSKIDITRYKVQIKDVNYKYPFIITGPDLLVDNLDLSKGVRVRTKGVMSYYLTKHIDYDVDIYMPFISSFEQENPKSASKLTVSPFKSLRKHDLKLNIVAKLKVTNKGDYSLVKGHIDIPKLSLKVKNKLLDKNSAKLVFNSDKVDINSVFYTSVKDKFDISGVVAYGKKKSIDLKVKALNTSLSNLQEFLVAMCDSFGVKNELRDYKVRGLANFDFQVKSNLKNIESDGVAKISKASISSKLYPFKITKINSNISFSDNQILIKQASALLNSMPFNVKGKISNGADVDIVVNGSKLLLSSLVNIFLPKEQAVNYQVNNGLLSFSAKLKGTLEKLRLNVQATASNVDVLDKVNKVRIITPQTVLNATSINGKNDGNLKISDIIINPTDIKTQISSEKITLNIDEENIKLAPAKFLVANSPVTINGIVKKYLDNPELNFDFVGKLYSNKIKTLIEDMISMPASAKGEIPLVGSVIGTPDDINLKLQLKANNQNYLSYIVVDELLGKTSLVNLDADIKNNNLVLNDASIYLLKNDLLLSSNTSTNYSKGKKIARIYGSINDLSAPVLRELKLSIQNPLTVSVLGLKDSAISLKSDLILNGKLDAPKIVGKLIVSKLLIPDFNVVSNNLILDFTKSNIHLKAPDFNIKNSKLGITANILPEIGKVIVVKDATLNSPLLDLDGIASSFSNVENSQVAPGFEIPLKILSGKARVSEFVTGDIKATNLTSNFMLKNSILNITNVKGTAFGGNVFGRVDYNFLKALTIIDFKGSGLEAEPAIAAMTGVKDNFEGKLSFESKVNMAGYTQEQQMKTLKGYTDFNIKNGQLGALGKFEHFLYAQNIISQSLMKATLNVITRAVVAKNTGIFKYLDGELTFNNGFAYIDKIECSGPHMSLFIQGRLNLLNNWGDLIVLGKVSNDVTKVLGPLGDLSISKIASKIPKLGSVSLPNIFFKTFNMEATQATLDKIPDLSPKASVEPKPFIVKILGNVESVKAVKSFKWLAIETPDQNSSSNSTTNSADTEKKPVFDPVEKTKEILPGFLNNLPDIIN